MLNYRGTFDRISYRTIGFGIDLVTAARADKVLGAYFLFLRAALERFVVSPYCVEALGLALI